MQPRSDPALDTLLPLAPALRDGLQLALQIAAEADGAPKRCRRQPCRRHRRCHASFDADGNGGCSAGLTRVQARQVALMLTFVQRLFDARRSSPAQRGSDGRARPAACPGKRPEGPEGGVTLNKFVPQRRIA